MKDHEADRATDNNGGAANAKPDEDDPGLQTEDDRSTEVEDEEQMAGLDPPT